jgi:hypothetical protein
MSAAVTVLFFTLVHKLLELHRPSWKNIAGERWPPARMKPAPGPFGTANFLRFVVGAPLGSSHSMGATITTAND